MGQHADLTGIDIHSPFAFIYPDAAARLGATGFQASDVRKLALQTDNNTPWMLTNHSPVAWRLHGFKETSEIVALASDTVPCNQGTFFTRTVVGGATFVFSSPPSDGAYAFTMKVTHTSGVINFPASVKWPGDTAPTLTAGRTHRFVFATENGGASWQGGSLVNYSG